MRTAIIVAVLLVVCMASYQGQQKHPQPSDIQSASQHAPPKAVFSVANSTAKEKKPSAYEKTKAYLWKATRPEFFAAWILVLAAGFGLWVTWLTAKAALLNAQAVINSERPWIEIDLGDPEHDESDENGDNYSRYSIQIENRGRTVAHIESCQIGSKSFGDEISFDKIGYRPLRVFLLLGSNQRRSVGNISFWDEFSKDDWAAINDGTKSAVVRIIVKYRDAIDVSKARETSVVFTWDIRNEHPERMPAFDEYK